jgi:hypothetical protein
MEREANRWDERVEAMEDEKDEVEEEEEEEADERRANEASREENIRGIHWERSLLGGKNGAIKNEM